MKKTTKTIIPLLALSLSFYIGQSQNIEIRKKITEKSQTEENISISKEFKAHYLANKILALSVAKQRNLPISGVNFRNQYFELRGIDEQGNLLYYTTFNSGSRKTARVDEISTGGSMGLNLDGQGMIAGVWDGAPALDTHVEFTNGTTSRMELKNSPPNLQSMTNWQLLEYEENRLHATHVSGTVAAAGKQGNARGIAPEAKIWSYDWDNDYSEMSAAANDGLLVSNHSYGYSALDNFGNPQLPVSMFGAYVDDSRRVDRISYRYPYYLSVIAAGNDRNYYHLINSTKNGNDLLTGTTIAKNAVVVAAVYGMSTYEDPSSVKISSFSNYGPTDDFRIKPDISAKGADVYSAAYQNPDPITAAVANNLYYTTSGTSMAAPAVTGVLTLWQQWAIENNNQTPFKSATLRALLAHTADEAGSAPGPDHMYGWGLINAKRGVEIMKRSKEGSSIIEETTLNQGEEYEKFFYLKEAGDKLTVTIAWTDPEGQAVSLWNYDEATVTPSLVNDLDLRVYKDGEEFLPWKLNKDFNDLRAVKGDNDVDNIEKIEIENASEGLYEVKIIHKNTLTEGKQDFSLVISSEFEDNFTLEDPTIEIYEDFVVWPNPVRDELFVNLGAENTNSKYRVFDLSGKLILKGSNINSNIFSILVDRLQTGVYILEVKTTNGVDEKVKFIKK